MKFAEEGIQPLLTVCMVSYNHEQYIIQALESVVMQHTDFACEVIVADDRSTDTSRALLTAFAEKYPIKLILQEKNKGATGNFMDVLHSVSGKYIAMLDGDDYWTDPNKLQTQVDFLEQHSDYAICFHDVQELKNGALQPNTITYYKETYDILDLAKGNFMHTPSVVYRNIKNMIPAYLSKLYVGDYIISMSTAKHGKIKFLPDVMAVYRIHDKGTWSTKNDEFVYTNIIEYLKALGQDDFNAEVKKILNGRLLGAYVNLLNITGNKEYEKEVKKLDNLFFIKRKIKGLF